MSEGFDYEAHRRLQNGNPDKALIVSFEPGAEKQPDGSFKNVEFIRIWMDKNSEVYRKVTEEDKVRFAERYAAYRAGEEVPETGTPISQCAFATPADVSSCKAERIFTLEQLVETSDERLQRAKLVNFKYQARDWVEAQKRSGYVGELRQEINRLKQEVQTLREKLSANPVVEADDVIVEVPKRRGRPPKVKTNDAEPTQSSQ